MIKDCIKNLNFEFKTVDDAKLVDIVKNSCPPDLWEFITSLTSSNKFKSAAEVDKTFENIDFKLINILFSLLFKFDTKSNTFQLIISDIIDKFTTSSSDCINILNKFGICVSKQTLERNQTMVVENKSFVISSNFNLLNAPRDSSGKCCDEIKDSLETDCTQNVIHECFTAVLTDSQFLEEKRFSQMTDYNIDEHVNHEFYLYNLNRVVNYLDMTALVYVTGSAVNIFEEHDNSIKPIVQLRANPDSNHSINLLNKNGLYFPLISRQDYFDGVLFQESIDIKDTITLRSLIKTSVRYRTRTTKLPHYAIHNSKICTDLVDDMIKDSAACLSKNVEKLEWFKQYRQDQFANIYKQEKNSNIPVETANVKYHSLLNKQADSKETLKTILDKLHQDFKIGRELKHLVVVGDGKTYDLLVKLKLELKDDLSWLLPFPGDRHILKNYQRMIMKLYLDAGLKELIELFHHGAFGAAVMQATNFDKTHHFLMQVWEAFYLQQISAILKYAEENDLNDQSEENYIKKKWKLAFKELLFKTCCKNQITDCKFYSRLLPFHIADLKSFPKSTIEHFEEGGWVVNILGRNMHSQGLDEAHESCINREVKNAMSNVFTLSALTKLVHYIPFRAKVLGNIKDQLECKRKDFNNSVNRPSFEIQNITSYRENIESGLFFRYENGQLKHAFNSKVVLTDIQRSDLLNLQKIAQEHLEKYVKICQSDGIFRYNKSRKIATFSTKTHSISKVKRELKDQRTENSLSRKQIAWSKEQNTPIPDLQQFISLPRAIVDHDGLPYKRSFVIGGGFENASITKVVEENTEKIATNLETNISEGDSRVWFHANNSQCKNILIYSLDNDKYHIGLSIMQKCSDKNIAVQLSYKNDLIFFSMNKFIRCLESDPDLHSIEKDDLPLIIQNLFILTGCDYVSFFKDHDFGWKLEIDRQLDVIWDSPENLQKVINNIKLWTAGCNCLKSDCNSKIWFIRKLIWHVVLVVSGSSCKNKNVNSQVCNTGETEENTAETVASTQVLYNSEFDASDFGDDTMDGSVFFELQNVDDDDLENIIFNFQYQHLA
ncbi:unnamed protein product [Mytilus coruscus]|uniref:Uncharacterized protein n=1 Tax=Mytilus coruscus TaxID=42192 RepID=A0A6J8CVA2_MYTCO|nr:unnamed protein product [Mytilus coruscus]